MIRSDNYLTRKQSIQKNIIYCKHQVSCTFVSIVFFIFTFQNSEMFLSTLKWLLMVFNLMFHLHLFTSTDHGSFVSAEDKGPRPPAPIASVNVSTPASVNVTLTCQMPPGYTIEKHRLKPFHMYFIFDYDDGVMGDIFATFTVDYGSVKYNY